MLKKIILIAVANLVALGMVSVSHAEWGTILRGGPYIGIQTGYSSMNYKDGDFAKAPNATTADGDKIAGRFYGGYYFTNHLGMELGYTYYGAPTFRDSATGLKEDLTQQGIDLSAVVSLTFDYGFGFYIKGGDTLINRSSMSDNAFFVGRKSSNRNALLFGCGVIYDFDPSWSLEIAWTQINSNGDLPRTDLYTAGFTYRFGTNSNY